MNSVKKDLWPYRRYFQFLGIYLATAIFVYGILGFFKLNYNPLSFTTDERMIVLVIPGLIILLGMVFGLITNSKKSDDDD